MKVISLEGKKNKTKTILRTFSHVNVMAWCTVSTRRASPKERDGGRKGLLSLPVLLDSVRKTGLWSRKLLQS